MSVRDASNDDAAVYGVQTYMLYITCIFYYAVICSSTVLSQAQIENSWPRVLKFVKIREFY